MSRLRQHCIPVVLFGASFLSGAAYAAELPDVAVVGLHQSGLDLDRQEALTLQLVELLEASQRAHGLTVPQVAGTVRGREQILLTEGLLGPGRAQLTAAVGLYNQAQPEAAIALLGEAILQLERAFPGTTSVDDLWRAQVYLGSAQEQIGEDGTVAFEAAAALAPARSPDPAQFPPNVVAAYDAARGGLEPFATDVEITLTSTVPVVVDGNTLGSAPVLAKGLLPGVHHVVAKGLKGSRGYEKVRVPMPEPAPTVEDGEEDAEPSVAPPPEPMTVEVLLQEPFLGTPGPSRRERSTQTASLYRALGTRASDVEYVLLGGVDGESLHMQLYHAPSDSFSRPVELPYDEWADDEVVTALPLLLKVIGDDGQLASTSPDAVPLDIGANSALASLLLDPPEPQPIGGGEKKRRGGGLVLGIVAGAAAVGLAGGGVWYATQGGGGGTTTTTGTTTPVASSGTVIVDL